MLDAQGKLFITDFGLAQIESDANLTMTGDVLGTLRYMSPEQASGQRGLVDQRSDVYSLGVTLYELLTPQPAFPEIDRAKILQQVLNDDPQSPRRLNPAIPQDLETIVLKAIAKHPAERYVSAQDLADDLSRFLEHKPIAAKRPTPLEFVAKWSRRHRPLVWSAVCVLLIATVVLSISTVLLSRKQSEFVNQSS